MSELKPCPFCGGEARVQHQSRELYGDVVDWYGVYCNKQFCGFVSGQSTEAEAIAVWNTRADDYRQAAEYWQRMYEEAFAERTCENNAPDYLDFQCSECGFVHYHSEANDTGEGNEWNYCPNCGARVTPKNSETTPKVVSE